MHSDDALCASHDTYSSLVLVYRINERPKWGSDCEWYPLTSQRCCMHAQKCPAKLFHSSFRFSFKMRNSFCIEKMHGNDLLVHRLPTLPHRHNHNSLEHQQPESRLSKTIQFLWFPWNENKYKIKCVKFNLNKIRKKKKEKRQILLCTTFGFCRTHYEND